MSKTLSIILGIVFVLVAILGFVDTGLVGSEGTFTTNPLHDIIHLVVGLIFLGVGIWNPAKAGATMKAIGVIYIILAILGWVGALSFLMVNSADNWLHLVLGVVIAVLGWTAKDGSAPTAPVQM